MFPPQLLAHNYCRISQCLPRFLRLVIYTLTFWHKMSVNFPFPSSPHWAPRMIVAIMSSCYSIDQYCQLLAQPMQTTHLRSSKREWWGGILTLCITLCTCMAGFSDPCEWGSVYRSKSAKSRIFGKLSKQNAFWLYKFLQY